MNKSVLFRVVKAIVLCFPLFFAVLSFNHASAQNITGRVFRDFNANGIQSVSNPIEPGVSGVTVSAFKADGTKVGASVTTDSDGSYTILVNSTSEHRIEFTNFPSAYFSGPRGAGSNTSTQFVKGGTTANLGINYPSDYCGTTNPALVTPCYINGTPLSGGNGANEPAIVSVPYSPIADGSMNEVSENKYLAKGIDVGTTWGIAYQRSSKFIFAGALLKRHAGFGTGGTGAIYKIDNSGTRPVSSLFVDLKLDLGIPTGNDPRKNTAADSIPRFKEEPSRDSTAFGLVGKIALGGLDLSDDEKTLWVINTFDGKLYELPIGSPATKPTTKIAHTLPNPNCTNGVFRPWAVKFWRGKVYVGGVCTAEKSGGRAADLKAYIYSFTPGSANPNSFSEVYNFPLNYPRGYVAVNGTNRTSAAWKPWIAQWSDITNPEPGEAAFGQTICPQPIFSDIEFDVDGSMVLGFMDRAGNQLGRTNYSPLLDDFRSRNSSDRNLYEGTSAGDLLRVGLNPDGLTYTLEKDATVNGITSGGEGQSPSQGPGNGEFYWQDMFGKSNDKDFPWNGPGGHHEVSLGGIALLPGKNEVVETVFDPVNTINSGGVRWFDNTTGKSPRAYEIFGSDAGGRGVTFGKANGLGDVELLCASQPIEVGNRLWNDVDKDGIQDAGEPVLKGVKVQLWKNGSQVGPDITTDAVTGEYYFTGLIPNQSDYEIRIPNVNGTSKQGQLAGLMPTTPNAGTNNDIDSDASVSGSNTFASIPFSTGNAGENNHTLDAGFQCLVPTAKPNGQDVIVCGGITTFDLPNARTAPEAETWTVLTSPANTMVIINSPTGSVSGMTVVGKYEFKLTNNATGCFETVSITVAPTVVAGTNQTICSSTTTLTAPTANQIWSVTTKPSGTNPMVATDGDVTGLTANGVYTFRLTEGTCFSEVQITKVTGPDAGADITTCATTATVNKPIVSETWSVSPRNPSPATIDAQGVIVGMINPGTYQFKLTSSNGNGCFDVITVTKTAGINLTTKNVGVCIGGTLNLEAITTNTNLTFLWSGPESFTSTQQNPSIADIPNNKMGVYTVVANSSGSCSATATASVTPTQITATQLGGSVNYCVGENLVLRDATTNRKPDEIVASYLWNGPDGFTASTKDISVLTKPDLKQAGTYSLKVTLTNGCFAVATIMTTVTKCLKLGNLVWNDTNNDGLNNNGELGVANVPVRLFDVTNPTVSIANTITGSDGKYLFPNLVPGSYFVEIEAPVGYKTSTGTNGSATGAYEPAPDPNSPDINDDDNGLKTTDQFIRSKAVVLDNSTEPLDDGDVLTGSPAEQLKQDKNSNLTIDFGIYRPAQLGNFVWVDTNKNGIQDGTELGVSGVVVKLYLGSSTTPVATVTTGTDGKYIFDNLIAGNYIVEFVKTSIGAGNSFAPKNTTSTTTDKDSDADLTTGKTSTIVLTEGESNMTIDAGIIRDCIPSAIGTIVVPSLCAGQSLTMRATSSDPLATYSWSRTPAGFTASTQEITLPNLTAGSSVYTVLITNSALCTSALTANVVVNPIPTIIVNKISICSGTTGSLTASGANSYSWSGLNGAFTATTATISVTQQGTYTVTGNSNGCTAIATSSVTVYPKTVLTATGAAICLGGNGTISVLPAGLNYVWTGPAAFNGSTLQTPTISGATDANKGTYTVSVTDGNLCISTATVAVTVGTALTVTPTSNSPVCLGSRLELSVSGGTGAKYLWTSPSGFTTSQQNPFMATSSNADNGVWTVAVENGVGCKGIGTTNVVINPSLTGVTATASAPTCLGSNINLTSTPSGAKSYEWTGTPTFTSSVQNPVITNPTANNYTFTVKVTNANGCTALATASTVIYAAPAATATSNSSVCIGNTINLGVTTTGTKFAWTGPDGFVNSTQTPSISNAIAAKDGIYTVVVTNSNSCNATSTVRVVVSSQLNGGSDMSICSPITTAQLTVISGATWSPDNTNPASATVDANGKVIGMTVNGTYAFIIRNAGGCTDIVKVFRNENLDAGDDLIICSPNSKAKLLKANIGQIWRYFANGQTQPTPTIDENGTVSGLSQDGSYLFILEQTGGTSYCADTVAIIRKSSPNAWVDQTVVLGTGICSPQTTAKLQDANTALRQTWSVATNSFGFGTVSIDANGNISKMNAPGIYTFVLTQAECTDSVKVEVIAKPNAGRDLEICSDIKTVKLPNAPANMTWSSISTNPVGTLINASTGEVTGLTVVGEYKFILKNAGGCTDTVSVKTKATSVFNVNSVQATCTTGTGTDAKLILSSPDGTATYDYNEGITYTGTKIFATGTPISTPVLGLTNPLVDRNYTVRVFNSSGCYSDQIVILKPRNCECKAELCPTYNVRKLK